MNEATPNSNPTPPRAQTLIDMLNDARRSIKHVAATVDGLRKLCHPNERGKPLSPVGADTAPNIVLAYRHLEDASMRLGKAIQAEDGGTSVYDRETTVGA